MTLRVRPFTAADGDDVALWRYTRPFEPYDPGEEARGFAEPQRRYVAVEDERGRLVGYGCHGEEARVPGGPCGDDEPDVLDLGFGLRPELRGRGLGRELVQALVAHALATARPHRLRATVAAFNEPSRRALVGLGFQEVGGFERAADTLEFRVLEREP